jgi:hypothetical protein
MNTYGTNIYTPFIADTEATSLGLCTDDVDILVHFILIVVLLAPIIRHYYCMAALSSNSHKAMDVLRKMEFDEPCYCDILISILSAALPAILPHSKTVMPRPVNHQLHIHSYRCPLL